MNFFKMYQADGVTQHPDFSIQDHAYREFMWIQAENDPKKFTVYTESNFKIKTVFNGNYIWWAEQGSPGNNLLSANFYCGQGSAKVSFGTTVIT